MLTKVKNLICTSLALVFAVVAAGNMQACCPLVGYQPEIPQKNN
ncbi:cyclic lactone autoinducer peptide [Syntrophomonas palmitatica]|nr:cyclic lactone autoinducer peptide [Syntrophomonas palmitatica]